MKKLSLILFFTFLTYIVSAQEPFKNRDGLIITPEKGEMSLGFDAVPFLKFIGNLFNPGNNIPTTNFTAANPLTISSNYMLKDNMALRSKIRIGIGVNKTDTLDLFIDYLLRPEVAARNSDFVNYANANAKATGLVNEELRNDPGIYPNAETKARLQPNLAKSAEYTRLLNRAWTRFTTGR